MIEWFVAGIFFLVALIFFGLSICSYFEKGILLHNAYLYATKQQRESMNKKPYYRQCAIVFFLIGILFLLNGCGLLLEWEWTFYAVMALLAVTFAVVVKSTIAIEKNSRMQQ